MGCQICRQKEPEANIPLLQSLEKMQDDRQDFQEKFDAYLQTFGQYYNSDFDSLISQNIKDYITNDPLQVDEVYHRNLSGYDMKPIEFKNGNIYQGGWNKNLKMEGQGKYFLIQENVFVEGIWKEGDLIFARVFIITQDNFDIYEGEIRDSNFEGKGKLILSNGEEYNGEFINGEKAGKGKITFQDGTVYEGQFENGKLKGEGKMLWANGYEYQGAFDGNKFGGYGTLKSPKNEIYEGEFENNLFNGNGKYIYQNGNTYEGQFSLGVKKGKGLFKCVNKFEFEGDWNNDLPCGVGKLKTWDKNGIMKSSWRDGKIIEKEIYEKGNKEDFEGIDFDIVTDETTINILDLTNLEKPEVPVETTQYKLGTIPSFLDE